jgi:UDP-N-acetylmuramoyl-tripeptide--D-alanyl-D-alanine ligase
MIKIINKMNYTDYIYTGIIILLLILSFRTLLWHLQNWQLREYRWDRLKAYFSTKQGTKNLFNLWFFRGILPRPKKSGRIFIILGFFILIHGCLLVLISSRLFTYLVTHEIWTFTEATRMNTFPQPAEFKTGLSFLPVFKFSLELAIVTLLVIWERLTFFSVALAISLSKIPVNIFKRILFKKAANIIQNADKSIIKIGITGSFGKSSTKEILVHLLKKNFGEERVLFNPENFNNEVAIARLILKNREFFEKEGVDKKFFICEIGAYKQGEIATVCKFLKPHLGILTGINDQHLDLFGSSKNIVQAKFELAEACSNKVFFNADNPKLAEIFVDKKITATKIPMSVKNIEKKSGILQTEFKFYGKNFTLPWAGEFFVSNAILALECARETGISREILPSLLKTIKPLKKALVLKKLKNSATILSDLYSANPDGVISAIEHLSKFSGKKYFIGMPLLELGNKSEKIHQEIFKLLNKLGVQVFWIKPDFIKLGTKILGDNFILINKSNLKKLIKIRENLSKNDVILLEGKLPNKIVKIFD